MHHRAVTPPSRWKRRFILLFALAVVLPAAIAVWLAGRFDGDAPVDYSDPVEHFKYGSTGGEHEMGFPYWIWRVLPRLCGQYLPGEGYQSLGMIFEKNPDGSLRDLPVGTSKRHFQGIDRVFLNCAACHAGTVRSAPGEPQIVVPGMPAGSFNMKAFEEFFFRCATDPKFAEEYVIPEIESMGADLDLLDRYVVYPVALYLMRDQLIALKARFAWVFEQGAWGPGRVDTFNSMKGLFGFPMHLLDPRELNAPADFPSLWRQRARRDSHVMELHWDGNNTDLAERFKSGAFGTGSSPPTIDLARVRRVEDWSLDAQPPPFTAFFPVDAALAARGMPVYEKYCAACHGASGNNFSGARVGRITPIADIATDRRRLDSYTYTLAVNQATLYAGYPWRFTQFHKTHGYANLPLDGLWLRAPYLHNGSVPSLHDLLEPASRRPKRFYRGNDLFDPKKVGFVSDQAEAEGLRFFLFDTRTPGNGNAGHEGKAYGTELSPELKAALLEFLKTF